jgi:16S rRNA G966 N2-methylase RsmD
MTNEIRNFKGEKMLERAKELDTFWIYNTESLTGDKKSVLIDNVQFIYELVLAQLELQSLGVKFEITNGFREFRLLETQDEEKLRKRLAYFKSINGEYTDYFYIIQKNRTRSVNQYLTHWIYPYKGKFHPQMIRALLNIIGLEQGDTVLDPFIGSGTTAVEAQLLGINCVGIDISPLCVLQSKVKVEAINVLQEIMQWKEEIISGVTNRVANRKQLTLFSSGNKYLDETMESIPNEKARDFYKMAKLIAVSDETRRGRDFSKAFLKNLGLMISSVKDYIDVKKELNLSLGKMDIKAGDSRELPLDSESIDGIITSPPYSIALDYIANDAHALKALGYNLSEIKEEFIGVRGERQKKSIYITKI